MSGFLHEIADLTRQRVANQKTQVSSKQLRDLFGTVGPTRPFAAALHHSDRLGLIAEVKQASPSAGVIRKETDIEGRLRGYERGGASAISVLTEETYFHGSSRLLTVARAQTSLPLLRKDFIIDPFQIDESRSLGADAILLIVAMLSREQLREFMDHARSVELECLVEVHDEKDLSEALEAKATLIGVNNRNLQTLAVDTATAQRLIPLIPPEGKTVVIESGIRRPEELAEYRRSGAHAVLIGETLMRNADAEAAVRLFTGKANG